MLNFHSWSQPQNYSNSKIFLIYGSRVCKVCRKGIWWCSTAVARTVRAARAGRMEAVADRMGAGWWSGRCRAWVP